MLKGLPAIGFELSARICEPVGFFPGWLHRVWLELKGSSREPKADSRQPACGSQQLKAVKILIEIEIHFHFQDRQTCCKP